MISAGIESRLAEVGGDPVARAHGEGVRALLLARRGRLAEAVARLTAVLADPDVDANEEALVTVALYRAAARLKADPILTAPHGPGAGDTERAVAHDSIRREYLKPTEHLRSFYYPGYTGMVRRPGTPRDVLVKGLADGYVCSSWWEPDYYTSALWCVAKYLSATGDHAEIETPLLVMAARHVPFVSEFRDEYTFLFRNWALERPDISADDFVVLTAQAGCAMFDKPQCDEGLVADVGAAARAIQSRAAEAGPQALLEAARTLDGMCILYLPNTVEGAPRGVIKDPDFPHSKREAFRAANPNFEEISFREDALQLLAQGLAKADALYAQDASDPAILGCYAAVLTAADSMKDPVIRSECVARLSAFDGAEMDVWNRPVLNSTEIGRQFAASASAQ